MLAAPIELGDLVVRLVQGVGPILQHVDIHVRAVDAHSVPMYIMDIIKFDMADR